MIVFDGGKYKQAQLLVVEINAALFRSLMN